MDWKKAIGATIVGAGLLGAGIAGGFAFDKPEPQIIEVEKEVLVEVPVEVEVIKEVEIAGEPVEVIVEVEDTEFLEKVCDRMMFDDIQECKEEVLAEDEAIAKALALINDENELLDFLEDEGFVADEDDAKLLRVYDDFEDIEIIESDFDDEEYEFKIKIRYEDEDEDFKAKAYVTVKVEDGEAEFEDIEEE